MTAGETAIGSAAWWEHAMRRDIRQRQELSYVASDELASSNLARTIVGKSGGRIGGKRVTPLSGSHLREYGHEVPKIRSKGTWN